MSATKPLCLFRNRSNFVGNHRTRVHLHRAGKVVTAIYSIFLLLDSKREFKRTSAVTVQQNKIKSVMCDLELSAQDLHRKTIVVNDNVKVLEGPSQGKQGIARHIYQGIVFLCVGNEEENGDYVTAKATMCEKVKLAVSDFSATGKDSEPGPLVFDDQPSSPRSSLLPKTQWQAKEKDFNRGDSDNLFAIGQTLKITIGPLNGYLFRVTGIRRSDVIVKLDSQQKFLTGIPLSPRPKSVWRILINLSGKII